MNASAENERTLHQAYLSLGSNIAPREYLPRAVKLLQGYVQVAALSPAWETPPVGMGGANFLNAAALIYTTYSAPQLKNLVLRRIEAVLGRVRTQNKFSPRTIDLDILVFDGEVLEAHLWRYAYLAVPLAALAPGMRHPQEGQTLEAVARSLLAATPEMRLQGGVFATP